MGDEGSSGSLKFSEMLVSLRLSSVSEMLCFMESRVSWLLERLRGIPSGFLGLDENRAPKEPKELAERNKLRDLEPLEASGCRRDLLNS